MKPDVCAKAICPHRYEHIEPKNVMAAIFISGNGLRHKFKIYAKSVDVFVKFLYHLSVTELKL